jgi:hypothetical protein
MTFSLLDLTHGISGIFPSNTGEISIREKLIVAKCIDFAVIFDYNLMVKSIFRR